MQRKIIQPKGLWDPRPRFAQVVQIGNHVYIAGQTAVDEQGRVVGKGDVEAQARQIFLNLKRCLDAVGASFENIVKITVFSLDLDAHQETIRRLRREHFREPVASTTLQVSRLVDPDWLLEIEAIAVLD